MHEVYVALIEPSTPITLPDMFELTLRTILETREQIALEGGSGTGLAGAEAVGLVLGLGFLAPPPFLRFLFFAASDGASLLAGAAALPAFDAAAVQED